MTEQGWLAEQFEQNRPHLEAVAYGMLGSVSEAQDAVQEAWLRLGHSDTGAIDDLRAWLTTVVGRISLDMLRSRKARREYATGSWLPEPLVGEPGPGGPEQHAVLADSIGLALLVVLESLTPAERLAFVLHDVFAVPFDEIARVVDRSPDSARQLASRARCGWSGSSSSSGSAPRRPRPVPWRPSSAAAGNRRRPGPACPQAVSRATAPAAAPG
jgi:RNA polymerase sigma-70 factor (ECF subfamily)